MENKPDGIEQYFSEAAHNPASGKIGSVVIGRAPFTCRQHLLIESASRRCDFLYVFVVSDKNDACSSGESLIAARTFASCIPNAGVYETGDYLIPCSSFPTYFIKDKSEVPAIKARLDSAVFAGRFAPILNISTLFMFSEPFPEVPAAYIRELAAGLRAGGIEIAEIPGGCHAAAFI
ncbi:MAG: hypothetical protein Q8878_07500 [Bacillota bacterium]|nr:hypothetical protein [Bacillota bacterium]